MNKITFFVPGEPKPQGRPRAFKNGGFAKVYSPLTEWRCTVLKYASDQLEKCEQLTGPLSVSIRYFFARPRSHFGTGKNSGILKSSAPDSHISRPDLDNLNKAILDAIGDSGLIQNDSQIDVLESQKKYCDGLMKPGAFIEIITTNKGE